MAAQTGSPKSIVRGILIFLVSIGLLTVGFKLTVTSKVSFGADFYTFWQAGRMLAVRGVSPYDPSTTELIQMGIYGRKAVAGEDQLRFAYPPFSLLPVLPSVTLPYPWAQAYWMALNLVVIYAAILAAAKKAPAWLILGLAFFYPVSRSVILGQFSLLIGAGVVLACTLLNRREKPSPASQWLAGVVLAWCAMKPQLSGVIILFVLLQCLKRRQWRMPAGLAAGGLFFAVLSWVLVPTWLTDWIKGSLDYLNYVEVRPILGSWLNTLGLDWSAAGVKWILAAAAAAVTAVLLFSWWKGRFADEIPLGWLILVSQLVNPNANSLLSDQVVFLIPLILWFNRMDGKKWVRGVTWAAFLLVPWSLFLLFLDGREPYAAASGLALLYLLWWLTVMVMELIQRKPSPTRALPEKEISEMEHEG